ncbi:MAG: hypothetical protein NFCOHLIN_01054 [Gammaproteobacteria bacterium]|nr:hypothetical protein [Gammaproteobacteria bacterium]
MKRLVMLMGVAGLLLGGCGSLQSQKRANSLSDTLNEYRILMRWGDYESALTYVRFRPGKGEQLAEVDLEALKQVRLASYDVVEQVVTPGETEAAVKVAMTYYHEESNVLHSLTQTQHWWFDEERNRWYLETEFPDLVGNMQKDR